MQIARHEFMVEENFGVWFLGQGKEDALSDACSLHDVNALMDASARLSGIV